jgi:TRAP-type C4-dicarboxylate transport system substrate-binding protein
MTYHNYGPTVTVINLGIWNSLGLDHQKLLLDVAREAQSRIREATESVDNPAQAKELLEPKGMSINAADLDRFREVAQQRIWPAYQRQYTGLWEEIVNTQA